MEKRLSPSRLFSYAQRDEVLKLSLHRVCNAKFKVYRVGKVWRQLRREGVDIAR